MTDAEPDAPADLGRRIDSGYAALTRQEQRAADFLLDHLSDVAVFTATEIAERSGVSKATVSRLFRRLGFSDAQEVREQARASRSRGVPVGPTRASGDLAEHLAAEQSALATMVDSLADGRLDIAARQIADARRVVVIGFRNGYPVALHLRQQLAQVRAGVQVAPQPGQSVGEELIGLTADDVVVLVGFRRRPAGFAAVLETLRAAQVPVVLLADSSARGLATGPHATGTLWLECAVGSTSAFDSYATAMSLVNLLASAVQGVDPRASRTRVAEITSAYEALVEVERTP